MYFFSAGWNITAREHEEFNRQKDFNFNDGLKDYTGLIKTYCHHTDMSGKGRFRLSFAPF